MLTHIALLLGMIVFSTFELNQKATASKTSKMLVEVSCGGDDNLTRGVCLALENTLSASKDFDWNTEEKKGH